ncbi:hypothetical protein HPB51_005176 [Rhipicephalus microplus]|uniref:Cytochrome n=1 Tax=Rhipicephalus microplus TaxID=6941 RepID=A0A9J6DLC7_RHIMP|nr:hypothetical protein HPB51_005176 [Rhipicephalus microplus]
MDTILKQRNSETMQRIQEEETCLGANNRGISRQDFYFLGVMLASADTRIGCLADPLLPASDGAAFLQDMNDVFGCLQIFGYRFPYFRYFRTPTWRKFEKSMDAFTLRLFKHIQEAANRLQTRHSDEEYTILEHLLVEKKLGFGEILSFMSDFIMGGADTVSKIHMLLVSMSRPILLSTSIAPSIALKCVGIAGHYDRGSCNEAISFKLHGKCKRNTRSGRVPVRMNRARG